MIDLPPKQLAVIGNILRKHVLGREFWAFGSRDIGRAVQFSDLDSVVMTEDEKDVDPLESLRDAFSESDLPIQVDVHDWNTLSESFRNIISRQYEIIRHAQTIDRAC